MKYFSQILLSVLLLSTFLSVLAADYPADENVFLKQTIDFSPASERQLDERWLVPPEKPYPFLKSRIKKVNGVLSMVCDGKPLDFICRDVGATTLKGAPLERQLREEGITFFQVNTDINAPLDKNPHHAFKLFKTRADRLLSAVPDAKFIVRIWMINVSRDFVKKYPKALLTGPDGETNWGSRYYTKIKSRPNALNEWRRYCGEALYKFIHDVGKSKYAGHVVGFYIGALNSGEWWYYKGKGDPGWDYSPGRKQAFKHLLTVKYKNKLPAKDSDIFVLPTLKERNKRPIIPCSKVSDYLQTLNLPVTNAAKYFAKIIKKATSGNSLAGMEINAGLQCFPTNGTVFISQLMDCPDIDFLGGPSSYSGRELGRSPLYRNASASLDAHNMIWFNEGDYRTHNAYGTRSGRAGSPTLSVEQSIQMLRREFVRSMIKNYPTYLMDFNWSWFYDRDLIREIGKLNRIGKFMNSAGMERNCEIAVVSDQESQLYANWFANPNRMRRHSLENIGCDYEFYELRDFLKDEIYKKYKFVIFLNIRALSDPERREIDKIKSDKRIVLWMHDPGVVNLSRKDANIDQGLFKLTGIKLKYKVNPNGKVAILAKNYQSEIAKRKFPKYIAEKTSDGTRKTKLLKEVSISDTATGLRVGNVIAPIASIDPEAVPLGKDQSGKCRFAIRKFENWTSVYAATCLVLPEIIRDLAKLAGCHIYLDTNDICLGNKNFVSVHAAKTGNKTIKLPGKADVYDVFSGKTVASGVKSFTIPLKWGETRLFYLGDPKKAEQALMELEKQHEADRKQFVSRSRSPKVPLNNYKWASSLPLKQFYELRKKWLKAPAKQEGPYQLSSFTSNVFLFSGPYPTSDETNKKIAELAANTGKNPSALDWNPVKSKFVSDNPARRASDKYLYLINPKANRSLSTGLGPWRTVCYTQPWINDYSLDIGRNQTGVIAFFLKGRIGQKVELAFAAAGDAEIWINGKKPEGKKGPVGTVVTLPEKRNLIMIRLSNTGGNAGFTCKFIEPGQKLKPGQQARKKCKGLSIWLKP